MLIISIASTLIIMEIILTIINYKANNTNTISTNNTNTHIENNVMIEAIQNSTSVKILVKKS